MSIACCYEGCGASVCFTPEVETRLRDTHEWWMCPFGHRQHFTRETEKEAELRMTRRARDRWRAHYEEVSGIFAECPLRCGYRSMSGTANRWYWMLKHLATAHKDEGGWDLFVAFQRARTEERRSA